MNEATATNRESLRVMSSVPTSASNPYFRLFYEALGRHGFELAGTFVPTRRWLRRHNSDFDILHFHWPEWIIRAEPDWLPAIQGFAGSWRTRHLLRRVLPWARILQFRAFLKAASASGKRIVWTCHNVEAHEDATWPVRAAFRSLARSTDLVICHDDSARALCETVHAPTGRVLVMPHGNYDGAYPPGRPKKDVLEELGLPADVPLLLCIGPVRPYKGADIACDAAAELGSRVSLLIAGRSTLAAFSARIKARQQQLPNAVFLDKKLGDQDYADLVRAADLVLLPYRSVTGSGAALAALTLGRGVIASDLPFFDSLFQGHASAGRVFASGDAHSLAQTILSFLEVPCDERERAAHHLASRFDWGRAVAPVARELRALSPFRRTTTLRASANHG